MQTHGGEIGATQLQKALWEDEEAIRSYSLGPRQVAFLIISVATVIAGIILATDPDLYLAAIIILSIFGVTLTLYRLDWGLIYFLGCTLLFDQYPVPDFDPFTYRISYFENLKVNYFPTVDALVVSPMELHLLFLLCVWIIGVALKKRDRFQKVPFWGSALLLFAWIGLSFARGMTSGGDLLPALWEIRALCYLGILYFFVPQVIQSKKQITALMWTCIFAISFKALQGIERFIELNFSFQGIPTLTSHEDAAFIVTLFIFLLALSFFKGHLGQRRSLLLLLVPLLMGYIVAQRRATFGSMGFCLLGMIILLSAQQRWRFIKSVAPVFLIVGIYLAIFWNSDSSLATPARLVKASFSNDREDAGEKYYSNLYRVQERYNLAMTVRREPVVGLGFGKTYQTPLKLPTIAFPLWEYIPHDEILWLIVKMGSIGFFIFWFFFDSFVVLAASTFVRLADPYLKAVALVVALAVLNQMFVSYFDLQLTFHRNMVYLGVLMGLLPALRTIGMQEA